MTEEEMNEQIVMVCLGLQSEATEVTAFLEGLQGCGYKIQHRLGDFHGALPGDVCPNCGGLVLEDRKGKPIRCMPEDDRWN